MIMGLFFSRSQTNLSGVDEFGQVLVHRVHAHAPASLHC
jgi:hypothetical protein